MRRGRVVLAVLLFALFGPSARGAFATAEASRQSAPDGTVLVVGNGWRPGQQFVVMLGRYRFAAFSDSAGSFEVATGLASYRGSIAIRRADASETAFLALDPIPPPPATSDPVAAAFARSVVDGAKLMGALFVAGVIGWQLKRLMRR